MTVEEILASGRWLEIEKRINVAAWQAKKELAAMAHSYRMSRGIYPWVYPPGSARAKLHKQNNPEVYPPY